MQQHLDELWHDDSHWSWWGEYRCDEDPRLVVRGRAATMYTLNYSHPKAWPVTISSLVLLLGSLLVPMAIGEPVWGAVSFFVVLIAIFIACDWQVNKKY